MDDDLLWSVHNRLGAVQIKPGVALESLGVSEETIYQVIGESLINLGEHILESAQEKDTEEPPQEFGEQVLNEAREMTEFWQQLLDKDADE